MILALPQMVNRIEKRITNKYSLFMLIFICLIGCNSPNRSNNKKGKVKKESYDTMLNKVSAQPKPYVLIDVAAINQLIQENNFSSIEEIARNYYYDQIENMERETVTYFTESEKNPPRTTIVHENIPDDSLRGIKLVIIFDKDGSKVVEIRKSIRCYPGRGHGVWSGENCL